MPPIDSAVFVAAVRPLLARQDLSGLVCLLRRRWSQHQIAELFQDPDPDVRKIAGLSFGLIASGTCLPKILPLLRDPDVVVNQMAEHALWSAWFRMGSPEANREVNQGSQALNRRDYEDAIDHFTHAIEIDPNFGEAFNQRTIVKYLQEKYDESIRDCERAVERVPYHFGAWAGMGHCHAHEHRPAEAVRAYERAIEINPHLDCVRQAIVTLRGQIRDHEA